jgi:hypothetical protein
MAKAKRPAAAVSAVKKDIAEFVRQQKYLKSPDQEGERQKIACKIKMLRGVARMIDDFYGDIGV